MRSIRTYTALMTAVRPSIRPADGAHLRACGSLQQVETPVPEFSKPD
jgi:hypothetical protein